MGCNLYRPIIFRNSLLFTILWKNVNGYSKKSVKLFKKLVIKRKFLKWLTCNSSWPSKIIVLKGIFVTGEILFMTWKSPTFKQSYGIIFVPIRCTNISSKSTTIHYGVFKDGSNLVIQYTQSGLIRNDAKSH